MTGLTMPVALTLSDVPTWAWLVAGGVALAVLAGAVLLGPRAWRWFDAASARQRVLAGAGTVLVLGGAAFAALTLLDEPDDKHCSPDCPKLERERAKPVETVNWPVYGYDDARSRYLPSKEVKPPYHSSIWSFQAGKLLEFSPIVVDDSVYFMDKDALFYSLDSDTGKVNWKRSIGKLNASSPAYADDRLFAVNLEPGQVVAIGPDHGKILWRKELPGRTESSPLVYGNKVIVGCECGDVFAFNVEDGKLEWSVSTAGEVKGGVALKDGVVYAGNYAGELYAIDAASGEVKWEASTQGSSLGRSGPIYSTPAVAYGRVYVGSIDSRVYSYDASNGELIWSQSTGAEAYPGPAVADTPRTDPTVYIGSADKTFYALDAEDGSVRWSRDVGGIVIGAASVIGEVAYVGVIGPENGTYGFDTRTGEEVFEHELGDYNPVISDGRRLYLTGYSELRAFPPDRNPKPKGKGGEGKEQGGKGRRDEGGGGGDRKGDEGRRGTG